MAKDEQPQHQHSTPPSYERRILDTKGLAQRLDLNYINRRPWLVRVRWTLVVAALVAAAAVVIPLLAGWAGSERAFSPGPVSSAHAAFEKDCWNCHAKAFTPVRDEDCRNCHAGALHHFGFESAALASASPAGRKSAEPNAPRCAECHAEHRGNHAPSEMADLNCTRCHADLNRHTRPGATLTLLGPSRRISHFAAGSHPRFAAANRVDERPLKLNHRAHMGLRADDAPGMKLPMACADCHQLAPRGSGFDMVPVNFDMHCAGCHAKELAFDIDQLLGARAAPVPHAKDMRATRNYVYNAYRRALEGQPDLWRKPPAAGKLAAAPSSAPAWLDAETNRSVKYLFERKCLLCHETDAVMNMDPVIRSVNQISGQFSAARPEGLPWFSNAEFSHRRHRTEECDSCHSKARQSVQTSDVLIPDINACLSCHGSSGTSLDRCAECHLYHDRSRENAHDMRMSQELMRKFVPPSAESRGVVRLDGARPAAETVSPR